MPYPNKPRPARMFPNVQAIHCLRFQINQTVPAPDGTGLTPVINRAAPLNKAVVVGTIPGGSIFLGVDLHVKTLFDGTTPAFIIGDLADDDGILTAASSAVGTAGFKPNLITGAYIGSVDNDVQLYYKLTGVGNTVGRLDGVIKFYVNVE